MAAGVYQASFMHRCSFVFHQKLGIIRWKSDHEEHLFRNSIRFAWMDVHFHQKGQRWLCPSQEGTILEARKNVVGIIRIRLLEKGKWWTGAGTGKVLPGAVATARKRGKRQSAEGKIRMGNEAEDRGK